MASLVLVGADRVGAAEAFAVIPTEEPVSGMALTEDGAWLVLAHQADNSLSIWDVSKNAIVRSVPCKSPVWILARGDKIYVANNGEGKISVLGVGDLVTRQRIDCQLPEHRTCLTAPGSKRLTAISW